MADDGRLETDPAHGDGARHFRTGLLLTGIQAAGLLLVLGQEMISARLFGARPKMDGYLEAWVIPMSLATLVGMALQDATIPYFAQIRAAEGERQAWRAAGEGLGLALAIFLGLGSVALLGHRWVLAFATAGASATARGTAAFVLPLGFICASFALSSALIGGALAAAGRFLVPAIAVNAIMGVPALVLLIGGQTLSIYALPAGYLLSSSLQLAILVASVRRTGFRLHWPSRTTLRRMSGMLGQAVALALAAAPMTVIPPIERHLAAGLGIGAVSHLFYASKLLSATVRIATYGMAAMSLSLMSAYLARGETERFRRLFALLFGAGCYISAAGIATFAVEGQPLIGLIFQRGAFTAADTLAVSPLLRRYGLSLVYGLVFPTVSAALMATKRARSLLVPNLAGLSVYLLIAADVIPVLGTGVLALALAYPAANLVALALASGVLVHREQLGVRTVLAPAAKASILGLVLAAVYRLVNGWGETVALSAAPRLLCGLVAGAATFVAGVALLDRALATQVLNRVRRARARPAPAGPSAGLA